jgi:hypothetical protein
MVSLHNHSTSELLKTYAAILRELRKRRVVRSTNNPVADLAEKLAEHAFGLRLAWGSTKSYDGICIEGRRWQVKGRRLTPENQNTVLSVIRNLPEQGFDYVLAIYFEEDFSVRAAYRIDHAAVAAHASYSKQQGGCVLSLKQSLLADSRCVDVTQTVQLAEQTLYAAVPVLAHAS